MSFFLWSGLRLVPLSLSCVFIPWGFPSLRRVFSGFWIGLLSSCMVGGNDILLSAARVYGLLGKVSKEKKCKRLDVVHLINIYLRTEYTKESFVTSESVNNAFFSFTPQTYHAAYARLAGFGWLRRVDGRTKNNSIGHKMTPEGIAVVKRFVSLFQYSQETDRYRRRKLGTGNNNGTRTPKAPSFEGFFNDDPLQQIKPTTADPGYKEHTHPESYTIEHFSPEVNTKAREIAEDNTPPQLKGWQFIV